MGGTRLWLPGVAAVLVLLVLAVRWLDLAPPDGARIAAGPEGGGYHALANRYAAILAEDGIRLEVRATAGSVENARLLAEGAADLALLQGGVPVPEGRAEAIAALFLEPLLLVERADRPVPRFPPDWRGLAIAAGAPGSGARFAFDRLAAAAGLDGGANRLLALGGAAALAAVEAGEADLAVLVAPLDAPYLAPLAASDRLRPVAPEAIEGLARRLPELTLATLPAGALDYAARRPAADLVLLAAPARLAAAPDLHPALVNRLVRAARRLHGPGDLLAAEGAFPSARGTGLALNPEARALLDSGPDRLETVLPYWVAAQIHSFLLLLLPVLFLLLPLVRALPGLYEWTVRSRIWRHYRDLREIDLEATATADPDALDRLSERLDAIEEALRRLRVPLRFRESAYLVRSHVEMIRRGIAERRGH